MFKILHVRTDIYEHPSGPKSRPPPPPFASRGAGCVRLTMRLSMSPPGTACRTAQHRSRTVGEVEDTGRGGRGDDKREDQSGFGNGFAFPVR